jgi:hypothetical protein
MEKLKVVQTSMNTQSQIGLDIANEISDFAMQSAKSNETHWIIYKLVNTKKKGRVYIDGIDDVINPQTKKMERIWLLTGANSIWGSDLVETLKDKDYVRNNRRSLQFEGGVLRVPDWDTLTLDFIKNCRHLLDNPSRRGGSKNEFFEYNPAKQQQVALDKEMLEMDMAIEASKMEIGKARKLANFFGIIFYDELGQPKTDDGIRRELMLFAKREPKKFQQNLNSKEVEVAYLVKKAILDAKIDLGGGNGNVSWANGGMIGKIPASRKPQEYLVELAMTNSDEGRVFLDQLNNVVK